jgi:protein O-mannosyl-transferase
VARDSKTKGKRQKTETKPRVRSSRVWLAAAVIVGAGTWAYANSFSGAFVFDDTPAIVENPHIRSLWPLTRAMSAPAQVTVSGRPVAALTFAVNYALAPGDVRDVMTPAAGGAPFGVDARYMRNLWGYHALNLVIHLTAGLALFGVVRRTLLSPRMRDRFAAVSTPLACAVALLWIVHPLHTESVTYLVQRVESLMGLFYLLTLYCAIRAWDAIGSPAGRHWTIASIVACALGMGTKEVMVSAPIVVAVWDFVFQSGPRPKAQGPSSAPSSFRPRAWGLGPRALLYLGLASTWLILIVLVAIEPRGRSVGFGLEGWTAWTYLLTQSEVILHYVRLALAPTTIVIDYGWPKVTALTSVLPEILGLAVAVALTTVAVVRRHPLGFAGAAFFLILAPSSSVLPIVTEIAAEHRMYLALAPVIATIVIGTYAVARRVLDARPAGHWARRAAGPAALVLIAGVAITFGNLTRQRNQDYVSQEVLWRDAVQKRPMNPRARVTYGLELLKTGRHAEAETQLRTAVSLDDRNASAQLNLGVVLCSAGKFEEGIERLERALSLNPEYTQVYGNLGEAYASQGRMQPALKYFLLGLNTQPDDLFLLNRAGWLLATSTDAAIRNGTRAVEIASRAITLTNGQDVVSLDTLAAAYAEVDRFADASATVTEAIRLARLQGRADILPELEARQRLYQAGQKFRQ